VVDLLGVTVTLFSPERASSSPVKSTVFMVVRRLGEDFSELELAAAAAIPKAKAVADPSLIPPSSEELE